MISIIYNAEGVDLPSVINEKESAVTKWILDVAAKHKKQVGEISYIFCSDEKILEINKEYLQHDYYTDIITFDYSEGNVISGDLFISLDTVMSNSLEYKTNPNEELLRVIIHGVLHLCGINDKTEEDEKKMRQFEDDALSLY